MKGGFENARRGAGRSTIRSSGGKAASAGETLEG